MGHGKASRSWLILLVSVTLVLVVMVTALLFLLVINKFTVEVRIIGDDAVMVEYGDSYTEQGATAQLRGSIVLTEGLPLEVRTAGRVLEMVLGEHEITYSASFGIWSGSAVRTVAVVDIRPPVITLFTNTAVFTRPGQTYREEGYLAVDNYDGDITDFVETAEENGVVTYTVRDSSGNEATALREIRYADAE